MNLRQRWHWLLGLISSRSCYNAAGKPKVRFTTRESAQKAADSMSRKTGRQFDVYRCWFHCRQWHFGGSVKTEETQK